MASKISFVANGTPRKPKVKDPSDPLFPLKREQILQIKLGEPNLACPAIATRLGFTAKYVTRVIALSDFKARLKYLSNQKMKTAIWDREMLFKKAQDLYMATKNDNVKSRILATLGKWSGIESSTVNHEFADMQRIQLTLNSTNAPIPEKTDEILSDTGNTDV